MGEVDHSVLEWAFKEGGWWEMEEGSLPRMDSNSERASEMLWLEALCAGLGVLSREAVERAWVKVEEERWRRVPILNVY